MGINNIILAGNLCADPKKLGSAESPLLVFRIACNVTEKKGDDYVETPMFFNCNLFGSRAKKLAEIMKKGMPVVVSGVLRPDDYEKSGVLIKDFKIVVAEIQIPPKSSAENNSAW